MDSGWTLFDEGITVGQQGDEGGLIVRDEEYIGICRITLEERCSLAPYAITCGIYGWFFHTRFFEGQTEAESGFEAMQPDLATIVESIPLSSDPEAKNKMIIVSDAIGEFVQAFP